MGPFMGFRPSVNWFHFEQRHIRAPIDHWGTNRITGSEGHERCYATLLQKAYLASGARTTHHLRSQLAAKPVKA